MIDPLTYRKSEEVKNLLSDFYQANFKKALLDPELGKEIIDKAWNVNTKNVYTQRKEIAQLFSAAKIATKFRTEEIFPLNLVNLDKIESFLDFGANKLETLNSLSITNPEIKQLIAVDVVPQTRTFLNPDLGQYYQINPETCEIPLPKESVDLINIQFVLHHIVSDEVINKVLMELLRVLKPGGRLLLWEETFPKAQIDAQELISKNLSLGLLSDLEFTQRFYKLSISERWQFIIFNDWVINAGNDHMQWTGLYKSWEEWNKIFRNNGFNLKQVFNLGFRINGKLKQGVHMLGLYKTGPD